MYFKKLYTLAEVADYLRLREITIRKWIGKIPPKIDRKYIVKLPRKGHFQEPTVFIKGEYLKELRKNEK